jgi:dienelactone hydrolase
MINLAQRRCLLVGLAVLLPLLLLATWKFTHGVPEAPLVASLADGRSGRLLFTSYNAQSSDLDTGAFHKAPVKLLGDLFLPEREKGRVPAVILMHGSDGLTDHQYRTARSLRSLGLAVFVVDSFTGRGVDNTITDQGAVTVHSMLVDAYQALALLQTHPSIDPNRIALVGWSKGGTVADWASRVRYRTMLSPVGRTFAAHVAFYPWCGEQHLPVQLTGAPLLYLTGERDDWTGTAACIDYVKRIREAGFHAKLVIYPHAEHAFDYPGPFRRYLGSAQSWAHCNYIWGETHFRVAHTGDLLPWTEFGRYVDACTSRGAHVGSNAFARSDAAKELREFLAGALALRKDG